MARITTKTLSYILVITLIFTALCSFNISAEAVSYPTTHPNTYKNTGNYIDDIVQVATTQIGYQENSAGTKYGAWYNESLTNQPWCAMFVSWCANEAGIPTSVIPKFASCSWGVNWFKNAGCWQDSYYYGGTYVPQKGDIVFYKNSSSGSVSDHVGIVTGIVGDYIQVIEGNATNESCCLFTANKSRTLTNKYVIGYGVPNYPDREDNGTQTPASEPDTYERWMVTTADYLSIREDASTSSDRIGKVPMGTVLHITEFQQKSDYFWGKTTFNGVNGWCALDYCSYLNGNINGVYYQFPPSIEEAKGTVFVAESKKLNFENSRGATYLSTKPKVVSVDDEGTILGLKEGTAKIKCTTTTGVAKYTVTVVNPTLESNEVTVCVGDKHTLQIVGAYGEVTYKSEDKAVAKVTKTGVIKGISAGKTVITATINGIALTCDVTVTKDPTTYENFVVTKETTNLLNQVEGQTVATVKKDKVLKITEFKFTDTFTWGKTTYKTNEVWVKLNHCKYVNGEINGTVYKVAPYLKEKSKSIFVQDTYTIKIKHKKGKATFISDDCNIATVDGNGVITGLKAGKTTIKVVNYNKSMSFEVTVNNPYLDLQEVHLIKGAKQQLNVIGGSGQIKWKSADKTVAASNKNGLITAKSYGKTTITATRNGVKIPCVVNVYDPILSNSNLKLKLTEKGKITVSQNYSQEIKFKSLDKTVAKVTQKGVVKSMSKGATKIAVTVDGITLYCNVKVK